MLRITTTEIVGENTSLRLEGQIGGPWTEVLREVCEAVLSRHRHVTLDLHDVTLIERPGLALLTSLGERGVEFIHCCPFHEELIRNAATAREEATTSAI